MLSNIHEAAGQSVEHFHVHLIPRYKGDTEIIHFHETKDIDFEELKSQYLKFPDKSDFVPFLDDNGEIVFYYVDDIGLQKAQFVAFSLGEKYKFWRVKSSELTNG